MEILIPGLILVALMVYASTKIKRNAAKAYEEETIEREQFSLVKPEGFIEPVRDEAEPAFLAYTKDFGVDEAAELHIATAEVRIYPGISIGRRREAIVATGIEIEADRSFQIGSLPALRIDAERNEGGVEILVTYLLISRNSDVIELRTELLRDYRDEWQERMEKILDSFEVR
jgi:hypothetical protein